MYNIAHTGFFPSVLVASMAGSLCSSANTRAADNFALEASGANELALPRDKAVNTTAANVLCVCVCV